MRVIEEATFHYSWLPSHFDADPLCDMMLEGTKFYQLE